MLNVIYLSTKHDLPPHDYWDHGMIDVMFESFVHKKYEVNTIPYQLVGGVVVIPARNQADPVYIDKIKYELSKLEWCIVILTGDEESVFPWREIKHPNMRVWVMSPKVGIHDDTANRIGSGYRKELPDYIKDLNRKHDYYFAGQVTHEARQKMGKQIGNMHTGLYIPTEGFGQGVGYDEYIQGLCHSKIAPCPSGPVTPDTFRLYEALECGCVPIADGGNYWEYLLQELPPFPIISDWNNLSEVMHNILQSYQQNANTIYAWWQLYKRKTIKKLSTTIKEVTGEYPEMTIQSDITVLLSTSAIPSHPDTKIIDYTMDSIREQLPNSEIIIMIDGLNPTKIEMKSKYDDYVQRLLWKTNNVYHNTIPYLSNEHKHQTGLLKEVLPMIDTPLLLFVEHDTPLRGEIDWVGLQDVVKNKYANVVRLHHEASILPDHKYLMLDTEPQMIQNVPLIRTRQWSQRPHLASTEYYRQIAQSYFTSKPMFIEHVMYGVVVHEDWSKHRVHIYAPEGETMLRSWHTNGSVTE